jgi:hypothetical protein
VLAGARIQHYIHLGDAVEDHAGDIGKKPGNEQAAPAWDEPAGEAHNQRCQPPRRHAHNGQLHIRDHPRLEV